MQGYEGYLGAGSGFHTNSRTLSTCMYINRNGSSHYGESVCPKSLHGKAMQRALINKKSAKYELVKEALILHNREDLIGFGPR